MSLLPKLPSFLSDQTSPCLLWCYTGGGHFFDEIFDQIKKINHESIPIWFVFSNAGALIANRYGFFWELAHSGARKECFHFIFENTVAQNNIEKILQEANFSYSIISTDPAFSVAVALANSDVRCIIACPLSANTAAKLAFGIADSLISNLLSAGLKSGKKIVVMPTDAQSRRMKTKLPIRPIKSASTDQINTNVCEFNALKRISTNQVQFLPQFCVGCKLCEKKFPRVFSRDQIEIKIREIDSENIRKLSSELTVLQTPREIYPFIKQFFQ
ncbi:MAG: flavoprotein [Candidatus Hodarchaeales archaeon]